MLLNQLEPLLIFIFTIRAINCDRTNEIKMINEYINQDVLTSTSVTAYLCWDVVEKYELLKLLFESNHYTAILDANKPVVSELNLAHTSLRILDLHCNNSINLLNQANKTKMLGGPYRWLLLSNDPDILKDRLSYFLNYDIYPSSNIVISQRSTANEYVLMDIYRYGKSRKELVMKQIANWTEETQLGDFKPRMLARERQNVNKTAITISMVINNNDSLNHLDDFRFKEIDPVSKMNYVFATHVTDLMNATLYALATDSWGYDLNSGMIGHLVKGEAEIGATSSFITDVRIPVVDFSAATTPSAKVRFVFRQPPLSYESNIFTLPFTRSLWIGSFSLLLLISVLLYYAVLWEWKNVDLEVTSTSLEADFMEVVMLQVGGVAQQGANFEPRGGPGKIIMIFSYIALMFLYVSYSANIVALLQSSATNINTLQDLLSSRMKLGIHNISYNIYYFTTTTDPIRKAIYERKIAPPRQEPHIMSLEEGIGRLRHGFFGFHCELGPGYKILSDTFLESEKCNLQEMSYLPTVDTYLPTRKQSPYKEIIRLGYRRIMESGLQQRLNKRMYYEKPKCHAAGGNFVSVGLIDSYPAFLVLGVGMGAAMGFLIFEKIASFKCRHP